MPKIKIRKSRIVPYGWRITGTVMMTILYGWLLQNVEEQLFITLAIALSPLLPILWMSFYVLEINDDARYWWKYAWVLGFRFGQKHPYNRIAYIALREKLILTRRKKELRRYEGVVIFDDGSECPLTQRKDQAFLYEKMAKIAEKVSVRFEDESSYVPTD